MDEPAPAPSGAADSVSGRLATLDHGGLVFLRSALEGSEPSEHAPNTSLHERVFRRTVTQANGVPLDEGHKVALTAVFDDAVDASTAAVAIQRELRNADFSASGIVRSRMVLHLEPEADPAERPSRTPGHVTEMEAAANDGQIVATEPFVRACDRLPSSTHWNNLGEYLITGIREPVALYELGGDDLGSDFPPLRATALRPLPDVQTAQRQLFLRLAEARDLAGLARIATDQLIRLTASSCGAFLTTPDRGTLGVIWEEPEGSVDHDGLDGCLAAEAKQAGQVVTTGDHRHTGLSDALCAAAVPLGGDGRVEAVVLVGRSDPYPDSVTDELDALAPTLSAALSTTRSLETMTTLALVDGLTNLGNRRSFDRDLQRALDDAKTSGEPLSLVMIDVDHFKLFNDTHGHVEGDQVLRTVAQALTDSVRPEDQAYRYGGEEFAVVLRDADVETALAVAERIRQQVERTPVAGEESQPGGRLTISLGLASATDRAPAAMITAADGALYRSKRTGRNRVSLDGGPEAEPGPGRRTRGNLPHSIDPIVGRDDLIGDVATIVAEHRLVTLTGVGGVGKTRLSLAIGENVADEFPDGVWVCSLVTASEDLVASAVAEGLGIAERTDEPIAETTLRTLADSARLLILDNCEHVVGAAGEFVAALIARCPNVQVLATGREALSIPGERFVPVPPLALTGDEERRSPAAQLFLDRATAVESSLDVSDDDIAAIDRICQRLIGIPLAIELAAAKVRILPIAEIADRLDRDYGLLSAGGRQEDRQATLDNAIDWSYRLLEDDERALFRRLSVFNGSAGLPAIHAIAGLTDDDVATLGLLESLVKKSLVIAEPRTGRFRVLEPLREFGMRSLEEEGEATATQMAHATWYLDLVEAALADLDLTLTARALVAIAEIHNLRRAMDWAAGAGETSIQLRLASSITSIWASGPNDEGIVRIERGLADEGVDPWTRAVAMGHLAWLYTHKGVPSRGHELVNASLELSAEAGRPPCASALMTRAHLHSADGELETTAKYSREAASLAAEQGDGDTQVQSLSVLTGSLAMLGKAEETRATIAAIRERWPADEEPNFGMLASLQEAILIGYDDPEAAVAHAEQALEAGRAGGAVPPLMGAAHALVGRVRMAAGHHRDAARSLVASLELQLDSGTVDQLSASLTGLGVALLEIGEAGKADEFFAAAQGVREAIGIKGFVWEQEWATRAQVAASPWSRDRLPELIAVARAALDD